MATSTRERFKLCDCGIALDLEVHDPKNIVKCSSCLRQHCAVCALPKQGYKNLASCRCSEEPN